MKIKYRPAEGARLAGCYGTDEAGRVVLLGETAALAEEGRRQRTLMGVQDPEADDPEPEAVPARR